MMSLSLAPVDFIPGPAVKTTVDLIQGNVAIGSLGMVLDMGKLLSVLVRRII